jgi:lipoprotein-anchoring transpeptidase ErfK/SrfK
MKLLVLILSLALAACHAPTHQPVTPHLHATPTPERWIEVDLARQRVRLHAGEDVTAEYLAATGRADTPSTLTYTGTFTVHTKIKALTYLPEFDVYVSDWVGFDPEHAIGFHSLPQNRHGQVVESQLGVPVSHGCVRVSNAAGVYDFAQIGMRVVVH